MTAPYRLLGMGAKQAWCLVAVLPLTACGTGSAAGSSSPGPTQPAGSASATVIRTATPGPIPTTAPPPTATGPRTLSEHDTGTSVVLRTGESVRVMLPAEFVVPHAQGDAVTRTAAVGGYPSGREAEATFTASRPGRAELLSMTDYPCLHSTPRCALPQQIWSVQLAIR